MSLGAEDRIHQWLRQKLRRRGFDSLGDDGAILPAGGPWAITQDHQIEGVHFPAGLDPSLIAKRLLAVNLSDLAAMGAEPAVAFLAISCPAEFDIRRLLASFVDACEKYEVELAGGDLARNDRVTSSVTLLGCRTARGRFLRRGHGQPGDGLWLAGALGLSAVGRRLIELGATQIGRRICLPSQPALTQREQVLAKRAVRCHLLPQPQLAVGSWLARRRRAAAIDISDGFALDLHRLCRESSVGARVEKSVLAAQRDLQRLCLKLGLSPLAAVLAGGEDYALLFALPPRVRPPANLECERIGYLDPGTDILLVSADAAEPLPAQGWDHFDSERPSASPF